MAAVIVGDVDHIVSSRSKVRSFIGTGRKEGVGAEAIVEEAIVEEAIVRVGLSGKDEEDEDFSTSSQYSSGERECKQWKGRMKVRWKEDCADRETLAEAERCFGVRRKAEFEAMALYVIVLALTEDRTRNINVMPLNMTILKIVPCQGNDSAETLLVLPPMRTISLLLCLVVVVAMASQPPKACPAVMTGADEPYLSLLRELVPDGVEHTGEP